MITGTPVLREFVFVMDHGQCVVDWGEGLVQDLLSGDFISDPDTRYCRPLGDVELDQLVKAGRVSRYDSRMVYLTALPESKKRTLD